MAGRATSHTEGMVAAMLGDTPVENFTAATGYTAEAGSTVVASIPADTDGKG
jgi:hypothetical protein